MPSASAASRRSRPTLTEASRTASRPMSPNRSSRATVGCAAPRAGEMDEADRLRRRPAVRPGDSGDADRDLGARGAERALRHRHRRLTADRAVARERLGRNAEQFLLGRVGIDDEAALEHVRRAGNLRQKPGDEPAGARFRRRDHEPGRPVAGDEVGGAGDEVGGKHGGIGEPTRFRAVAKPAPAPSPADARRKTSAKCHGKIALDPRAPSRHENAGERLHGRHDFRRQTPSWLHSRYRRRSRAPRSSWS